MNSKTRKTLFSAAILIACFGAIYSYTLLQRVSLMELEINNYSTVNADLLETIEENTEQRLALENEISRLNDELLTANTKSSSQASAIVALQEMIDPDYELLREQALQAALTEADQTNNNPLAEMMRIMADPDMAQYTATMQVNTQYNTFLNSLDRTSAAKDAIREILIDTVAQQSQLSMQIASGELDPADSGGLLNPNAVADALSEVLNSDEIELFDNYQDNQIERLYQSAYKTQLSMIAPDLPDDIQQLVVDAIVDEMSLATDPSALAFDPGADMSSVSARQIDALRNAQNLLSSQITGADREQVDQFINQMVEQQELSQRMVERMRNPQ